LCTVTLIILNSVTNGIMHGLMPDVAFLTMGFSETRRKIIENELV
jgi:hypothetical protein